MPVINSGNIIQKPETTIDPRFFLPPGVIDVRTKTRDEANLPQTEDETFLLTEQEAEAADDAPQDIDSGELVAPGYITIISQSARYTADGQQIVDVIVEVEDVPGANNYDVRVTKA